MASRKELSQFCDQFAMDIPILYSSKSHKREKPEKKYIFKKTYKKSKTKKKYKNKNSYPSKEYYKKSSYKKPNKEKGKSKKDIICYKCGHSVIIQQNVK